MKNGMEGKRLPNEALTGAELITATGKAEHQSPHPSHSVVSACGIGPCLTSTGFGGFAPMTSMSKNCRLGWVRCPGSTAKDWMPPIWMGQRILVASVQVACGEFPRTPTATYVCADRVWLLSSVGRACGCGNEGFGNLLMDAQMQVQFLPFPITAVSEVRVLQEPL